MFLIFLWSAYGMTWGYADFEDGALTGMILYDVDTDGNGWEVHPLVKGGAFAAKSESGALNPDNWIVLPRMMEVERYSDTVYPHIKFNVSGNDPVNFAEKFQVLVSYGSPAPAAFFVVHEETLTSADWKEVDIDLMPFFTEFQWTADMFVAIRHFDSTGQSALLFDELMVYTKPAFNYESLNSVIVEGPIEPYTDFDLRWDIYDRTAYDDEYDLTINDYDSVQLHYIITDDAGEQPEVAIDIFPTTDLTCDWCYDVTIPGRPMGTFIEYWLVVVDGSGYGVFGESQHFNVEWGEINIDEGFEYGALPPENWLPAGWTTFQTNQGASSWDKAWEVDVAQQNFHSGEYSITSVSQSNFGVWESENYLVSPRMRINGVPSLKYFVNAQTPEGFVEKWSLLISTVDGPGTDIENFTLIYTDSIVAGASDEEWEERVMLLDDYTDEYIRIMWKHHYVSVAKLDRYLNIDDISIAEMPVVEVWDVGNAALPSEDVTVTVTATDYSDINNATLYYTIDGGSEIPLVMTDNGDDTFTAIILGQVLDTRCTWYVVVTDDSAFGNTTTTDAFQIIWFVENWFEWASTPGVYPHAPYGFGTPWIAAMDWNFGSKGKLYLNKIEARFDNDETVTWKLVEFDGVPTDNVIGTYQGVANFSKNLATEVLIDYDFTEITGHVALALEINGGQLWLDESGDKTHAWEYTEVLGWNTNAWGAFHLRMYVSNVVGIDEGEFIANTTELCQNYPNPFNPTTSIEFFNIESGNVNLTVYNVAGEKVASLVDGKLEKGYHKINFDAARLNSGVYYYTLVTPETRITKKMVLVK